MTNVAAIGVLIAIYCCVLYFGLFHDYLVYIYWTINVLITYNILVASADYFTVPFFTILVGAQALVVNYYDQVKIFDLSHGWTVDFSHKGNLSASNIFSVAQGWQLVVVGVLGFFVGFACIRRNR